MEAVGATMWLGEPFWEVLALDKKAVLSEDWIRSVEVGAATRITVQDTFFDSGEGPQGDLQNRLRGLLFNSSGT